MVQARQTHPFELRRPWLLALASAALLGAGLSCAGELDGDVLDEEGWELNSDADSCSGRHAMSSCGSGVKPAAPSFGSSIDGYASYVGQTTCSATAKPGVTAFSQLILKTYTCTSSGGIVRGCSVGGTSEHKEGRAWDWMVTPSNPASTALLNWLLATDASGNKHAMARRLGIMYMIFNKKMWRAYKPSSGWLPYTGSNPHTDHVHFSFSWNGANKKTSFWTTTGTAPKGSLESAACTAGLAGWAQDSDAKTTSISVKVVFDKSSSSATSSTVKANVYRSDLCSTLGSCSHGFKLAFPASLRDGASHEIRAYALDSSTGNATELSGSPKTLECSSTSSTDGLRSGLDGGGATAAEGGQVSSDEGAGPTSDALPSESEELDTDPEAASTLTASCSTPGLGVRVPAAGSGLLDRLAPLLLLGLVLLRALRSGRQGLIASWTRTRPPSSSAR
jgi:hypothetical protein